MANWTGKTLGSVHIGELIARGGMAEVYLAEHTTLNRKVAVKIMRDHVDADPDNHYRFEREARVVANLRHPNIIQVFDYELVDEQPFLIMELVSGPSLGDYLKALHKRGEKLSYATISHILSALASAVDYAHNQQIIHRDIKPANVLLRSASGPIDLNQPLPADVEPILSDFGLVRMLDASIQTSTGTVSGTPAYMSPEQARGDKVDLKTDIYSLGVMLYEMLAGTVPFDAESTYGIMMKHLNDPPPPIFGISPNLQTVINRALAKKPEMRFATAKELTNEFTAVFNGETISAGTLNFAKLVNKSESKRKQRHPLFWPVAGICIISLIGIAFWGWQSYTKTKNKIVGQITFSDQNGLMDKATISLANLPAPKAGTHYDVWFLAEGGEKRRNVGSVELTKAPQQQLIFTDPEQENILELFDQIEVTVEANNDPNPDESSGDIVASSVFPPLALIHIRHLLVEFPATPDEIALIQGLWDSTDNLYVNTNELEEAFLKDDEALVRKKTEEIINQIVGSANKDQYLDWNKDGEINDPFDDGFGILQNGEPGYSDQGYINQTISHAKFSANAIDATMDIKTHGAEVVICLENIKGWSGQLLEKALELQEMPFGSDMGPLITEMTNLSDLIVSGTDSNGNKLIEPIAGEGGATTAYEYAYYLAEMPLLSGAHRIPPAAGTKRK